MTNKSARSPRRHVVILDENLPVPLDRRVWLEACALRDAGYAVSVISPKGKAGMRARREVRDEIQILRYPQQPASGLSGYLLEYVASMTFTSAWLLWLRSRGRIDVLHGCNPPDLFFMFGLIGESRGVRFVYDQHDANPELSEAKWGNRRSGRLLRRLTEFLERASYHTASLVIVPNDSYGRIARERGRVEESRLVVVRNAPPSGHLRTLADGLSPAADGPFRIGYLGVMGSQDGVETLVESAAVLRRTRPNLEFEVDLIGDGESRIGLERLAAELGVADRLHFHGYMQAGQFVPILAGTHVCVSPDPPTPFSNVSTMTKVVEYLAIGRPVVTFDLEETRMLLGNAGLALKSSTPAALAEALADLADDRAKLGRLTDAARVQFGELNISWERSSESLLEGYARLAR